MHPGDEADAVVGGGRLQAEAADRLGRRHDAARHEPDGDLTGGIKLRIPGWARNQPVPGPLYSYTTSRSNWQFQLLINGNRTPASIDAYGYVSLNRTWKNGDRIELNLPMKLRLEAIDPQHPQTVALLCGPLVLFALTDVPPVITAQKLLAARKTGPQQWQAATAGGTLNLLPFTAIADQQYSTYLTVQS